MKPKDALRAGVEELDPVLVGEGFRFSETSTGKSSGGEFASGEYRRGDRWLELHLSPQPGPGHSITWGLCHSDMRTTFERSEPLSGLQERTLTQGSLAIPLGIP